MGKKDNKSNSTAHAVQVEENLQKTAKTLLKRCQVHKVTSHICNISHSFRDIRITYFYFAKVGQV